MTFEELELNQWFRFCQPTDRLGRYEKMSETEYAGFGDPVPVRREGLEVVIENMECAGGWRPVK